jgi:glycosyltransferase involved in cell wall biosynthesis
MKVLQLVKTSVGATWAWEQMCELRKAGTRVSVILPGEGPMVERYRDSGIEVRFADLDPVSLIRKGPAHRQSIVGLVESLAPDVIHSHFVQTTLTARLVLGRHHRIPRFFQIAGPLHLENYLTRQVDVRSAGLADYWVPACELSRTLLLKAGVAPDRMRLIYHGLRRDRFATRPAGRLRSILGIDAHAPIIGMVAYMYAPKAYLGQTRGLKGHEDLIDAMTMLPERFSNAVLVMVGGPWGDGARAYADRVISYGKSRLGNRVHFLGTRSDVLDLYPDISVAVHPSHSENLGGAVESMMMGVPTITTRVGGFPDIVIPGQTGWLAEARSPASLAREITTVLADGDLAKQTASSARTFVADLLDITSQTRRLTRFYEDVVSQRNVQSLAA